MSAQVYSLPDQTEGRRKAFYRGDKNRLSSKLSLIYGRNVNHHKNVDLSGRFQKIIKFPFKLVPKYILFLTTLKGRGSPFFRGCRNGAYVVKLPPLPKSI